MADYRQIHCKAWRQDEWFCELSPLDKLLFIYLFSNESASVSGVYELLPVKVIAFETGIEADYVLEALDRFEAQGKIKRGQGWIWIVNLRKYNASSSPTVAKRIERDINDMPDGELKTAYIGYYNPIDRVSIHPREQEQETEQETEQEEDIAPAAAQAPEPPPPKRSKKPPKAATSESRAMFAAMCSVCCIDWRVAPDAGDKGKQAVRQSEKILREQGYVPSDVADFKAWWDGWDWRGVKGQAPTPAQVRSEWGQMLAWRANGSKLPPSHHQSKKGLDASKEAFKGFLANHGVELEAQDEFA